MPFDALITKRLCCGTDGSLFAALLSTEALAKGEGKTCGVYNLRTAKRRSIARSVFDSF